MISGIYVIRNLANGKVYVGSAVNLTRRKREHFARLNRNDHHSSYLQRAWNKYGAGWFKFEIIEYCDIADLISIEDDYIKKFNALNENFGYNTCVTARSALGRIHTQETKDKIANSNRGQKRDPEEVRIRTSKRIGKKLSVESAANIGKGHLGLRYRKPSLILKSENQIPFKLIED